MAIAKDRYRAAFDAYQELLERVAEKLNSGATPSAQEIMDEANAIEALAIARRELLAAITAELSRR